MKPIGEMTLNELMDQLAEEEDAPTRLSLCYMLWVRMSEIAHRHIAGAVRFDRCKEHMQACANHPEAPDWIKADWFMQEGSIFNGGS